MNGIIVFGVKFVVLGVNGSGKIILFNMFFINECGM